MPENKMIQKILSFIVDDERFLATRNNSSSPEKHGGDFWFTVTGSIEKGETKDEAVIREIKEETNLDVKEVFDLNWGSIYKNWQGICREFNLISFVDKNQKIKLDMQEVVEYKGLPLNEFVDFISWGDDKKILKEVLQKALKRERYFKTLTLVDYRN